MLYIFFTHVRELFGDVVLRPVVRPLRWSNMATMPALPETQESIKEEIRRQASPHTTLTLNRIFSRTSPAATKQLFHHVACGVYSGHIWLAFSPSDPFLILVYLGATISDSLN